MESIAIGLILLINTGLGIYQEGKAEAALLASLLHYGQLTVTQIKTYLNEHQVPVRLTQAQ